MAPIKAITLRLERQDYESLEEQAKRLGVRPGTMARMLVRSGLSNPGAQVDAERRAGLEALDRLARLRETLPEGEIDVEQIVRDGREELGQRSVV